MKIVSSNLGENSHWLFVPLGTIIAAWFGMNVSNSPMLVLGSVALSGFVLITTLGSKIVPVFLSLLLVLLAGYLLQGRGFAYWGISSVYVGERALILGISCVVFTRTKCHFSFLEMNLLAFMIWGLIRTLPYYQTFGLFAVRDAALWYYATFALLVSWLITERRLRLSIVVFARFLPSLIVWFTVMSVPLRLIQDRLPHFPGSPLPILSVMKPGDRAVFLVWMAAFLLSGLYDSLPPHKRIANMIFWPLWAVCAVVVAVENRGGIVAICVGLLVVAILRPSIEWLKIAFVGLAAIALLLVWNPTINIGIERELSVGQLSTNLTSIVTDDTSNVGSVQGTKDWRTQFWTVIYDDVVRGPFFWTGRGFGLKSRD